MELRPNSNAIERETYIVSAANKLNFFGVLVFV